MPSASATQTLASTGSATPTKSASNTGDNSESDSSSTLTIPSSYYVTIDSDFSYDEEDIEPDSQLIEIFGSVGGVQKRFAEDIEDDLVDQLAALLNIPTSSIRLLDLNVDGSTYEALVDVLDAPGQSATRSVRILLNLTENDSPTLEGTVFENSVVLVAQDPNVSTDVSTGFSTDTSASRRSDSSSSRSGSSDRSGQSSRDSSGGDDDGSSNSGSSSTAMAGSAALVLGAAFVLLM